MCYDGVTPLSNSAILAMAVFGIAGWLFLSILSISKIISLIIEERHPKSEVARYFNHKHLTKKLTWMRRPRGTWVLFIVVTLLEISQIWAYFLMQHQQYQMIQAEGISNLDEQWAFGQIVAVVVFAPVVVKAWSVAADYRAEKT
jgi:hypothetical protein